MELYTSGRALRDLLKSLKKQGKSVGFVPTMGFLHEGHKSLMERGRREKRHPRCKCFVNPTQFGPDEDLESYPRDLERDKEIMADAGVDYVFFPSVDEMYPTGYNTYVDVEGPLQQAWKVQVVQDTSVVLPLLFQSCSTHVYLTDLTLA